MDFEEIFNFFHLDPNNIVMTLLILMTVIWTAGQIFSAFSIPSILGEIIAGIIIGPKFLGIIPESHFIEILAELGVFFIMFHSGLDSNVHELLKSSKLSFLLASGGIFSLFVSGFCLTKFFLGYSGLTSMFVGAVIAVTSFPIIARFLKESGLQKTKIGHAVLGATVVDDVMGFILISVAISAAKSGGSISFVSIFLVALKVGFFFFGTLFLGKKILPYFSTFLNTIGKKGFTFSLIIALFFGIFAELIGLHAILGAFLGGMFVREEIQNEKMFRKIEDRFYGMAFSVFGPVFFASIGMEVSFEVFVKHPLVIFVLIFSVFLGHLIGTGMVVKFFGKFSTKESVIISFLASGRGAMEIIIAKIGFDTFVLINGEEKRLLPEELFSGVVALAITCTVFSGIALRFLVPKKLPKKPNVQKLN